jgi:hypothetical protein
MRADVASDVCSSRQVSVLVCCKRFVYNNEYGRKRDFCLYFELRRFDSAGVDLVSAHYTTFAFISTPPLGSAGVLSKDSNMSSEVSANALKPEEVSRGFQYSARPNKQSRFTGEGADLILLHWLRHAEQAIEQLSSVSHGSDYLTVV